MRSVAISWIFISIFFIDFSLQESFTISISACRSWRGRQGLVERLVYEEGPDKAGGFSATLKHRGHSTVTISGPEIDEFNTTAEFKVTIPYGFQDSDKIDIRLETHSANFSSNVFTMKTIDADISQLQKFFPSLNFTHDAYSIDRKNYYEFTFRIKEGDNGDNAQTEANKDGANKPNVKEDVNKTKPDKTTKEQPLRRSNNPELRKEAEAKAKAEEAARIHAAKLEEERKREAADKQREAANRFRW